METTELSDEQLDRMLYASSPFERPGEPPSPASASEPRTPVVAAPRVHLAPRRGRKRWVWVAPLSAVALTAVIVVAALHTPWVGADDAPAVRTPSELPNGLIGSGRLVDAAGAVVGTIEATASDGATRFTIRGFDTLEDELQINASLLPPDEDCLPASSWAFVAERNGDELSFTAGRSILHGDPTAIDQLAVVDPGVASEGGCSTRFAVRARMDWTAAPTRAWLADVVDAGPRAGAGGQVSTTAAGQRRYLVAADDRLADVAARFGISEEDVFYLNEARAPNPEDPVLHEGEELNLDLAFR